MNRLKVSLLLVISLNLTQVEAQNKILFVVSNQDSHGNTKISASNNFEAIVVPYDIFIRSGFSVDFISPKGGAVPVGDINTSESVQKKYLYDGFFMDKLEHTMKPGEIVADNYSAIFYSGGSAAMYGIPEDTSIQKIAIKIYNRNGVVSTIGHGTAGIAYLKRERRITLCRKENNRLSGDT